VGKPYPYIYEEALRRCAPAGRVLAVGDSLHHDILGAAAAGLDSLFVVETGVHAQDLAEVSGASVAHLAAAEGVPVPTFVMRKFRW
jgi:ribonucleotide monophosphatase NagD (HAD superfamily)